MTAMTIDEIAAQLEYCTVIFKSGLFSDIKSPEEMFVIVEAGKLQGKSAFESIQSLRAAEILGDEALDAEPVPQIGKAGVVAAAVESIVRPVEKPAIAESAIKSAAVTTAGSNQSDLSSKDSEDIETYLEWLRHIHDTKALDRFLFKLKFEEDREHVKAAVRPAFKELSKKLEEQERRQREGVQQSTPTFRAESASKADGHKNMASISQSASGNRNEGAANDGVSVHQREGVSGASISAVGQAVNDSSPSSPTDISVILDGIISEGIKEQGYDITPSEQKHMVAKIISCRSAEDLYAAADSINKYYVKHTTSNVLGLLDQLCSARLQSLMGKKENAA